MGDVVDWERWRQEGEAAARRRHPAGGALRRVRVSVVGEREDTPSVEEWNAAMTELAALADAAVQRMGVRVGGWLWRVE